MTDFTAFKFCIATHREIEERKGATVEALLSEPGFSKGGPRQRDEQSLAILADDVLTYLLLIKETPDMKTVERDRASNIATGTGDSYRKKLLKLELIEEVQIPSGTRGRPPLLLWLTDQGESILNKTRNKS